MPRIINYLNRVVPGRSYDEHELARLQLVYGRVCTTLGIGHGDPRRETIAMIIFQLADAVPDSDALVSQTISRFEHRV